MPRAKRRDPMTAGPSPIAILEQAGPVIAALAELADRYEGRHSDCKASVTLALCRKARFVRLLTEEARIAAIIAEAITAAQAEGEPRQLTLGLPIGSHPVITRERTRNVEKA